MQAVALLLQHAVHVALFSSSGRYRGQLVGPEAGSVFLRLAQHARHADLAFRLAFARYLVAEKCRAGRAMLQISRRDRLLMMSVMMNSTRPISISAFR